MEYLNLMNKLKKDVYTKWLILSFLLLVLIKSLLTLQFQTPWIFADETVYADIAKNIWFDHIFISTLQAPMIFQTYPPGYSLILSISYLLNDKDSIYHVMLFINVIITSLIIFPSYFISKKFIHDKFAFLLAILIAISPSNTLYNFELMSENLFLPIFLFSAYFVMEALTADNKIMQLVAGFCVALLYLTKNTGAAMIVSFFIVFIYYIYQNKEILGSLKRKSILLISFFGTLLIWMQLKIFSIKNAQNVGTPGYPLSEYIQSLFDAFSNWDSFSSFIIHFIHEIDYIIVATFFIFFSFAVFALYNHKQIKNKEKFYIFFLYSLVSTLVLLGITVTHMFGIASNIIYPDLLIDQQQYYSIFGRYIDPFLPIVFILGGIGIEIYNNIKNKYNSIRLGSIFFLAFILAAISFPDSNYKFPNMLSLFYIQYIKEIIPILVFFMIFIAIFLIYMWKRNILTVFIFGLLISLIAIVPTYQQELTISSNTESQNQIGRWLQQNDRSKSITFMDGEDFSDAQGPFMWFLTKFWMNGELMVSNDTMNLSKNADFIISSKLLPYESITSSPKYKLYDVHSSPNFSNVYAQLANDNYIIDIGLNDTDTVSNFWDSENNRLRWSKNNSEIKILYPEEAGTMRLIINVLGNRPPDNPATLKLHMNKYLIGNFTKKSGEINCSFEIQKIILNPAYQILTIETNTWNPGDYGSEDIRDLGIQVDLIKVERAETKYESNNSC